MIINSTRVGPQEVLDKDTISFSTGVVGLPDWQQAIIVPVKEVPLLSWLQFTHDPDAAFLLLDVGALFPDYDIAAARANAQLNEGVVYTIVRVPGGDFAQATTNLMAPIVIGRREPGDERRVGVQIVLHDLSYPLRHPLFGGEGTC